MIVTYWLPSWVCILPAFDFRKLASLNKAWKIDKYYCENNLFTKIRLVCNDLMEFGFFMKGILSLGFKCLQQEKGRTTARKAIFPKSWNIKKNSKRPSIYHLSINFLAEKKTVFPITKYFSETSKCHLSMNFFTQKKTIFPITQKFKARTFQ